MFEEVFIKLSTYSQPFTFTIHNTSQILTITVASYHNQLRPCYVNWLCRHDSTFKLRLQIHFELRMKLDWKYGVIHTGCKRKRLHRQMYISSQWELVLCQVKELTPWSSASVRNTDINIFTHWFYNILLNIMKQEHQGSNMIDFWSIHAFMHTHLDL